MVAGLLSRRAFQVATGLALVVVVTACKKEEKGTPLGQQGEAENAVRASMPAEGRSALDQGNELFRQKKYDEALARYREAAEKSPNQTAPWFGVYMVAQKQGNKALGDSAQAQIRKISPEAPLADEQLQQMHQKAGTNAGPIDPNAKMPAGHPPMPPKSN